MDYRRLTKRGTLAMLCVAWLLAAETAVNAADTAASALKPAPSTRSEWAGKHQRNVERAKRGSVDLLFMGDSITEFWSTKGQDVWTETYEPLKAANFGIAADKVENVLWRLTNGELDGISPKVVVLMIGINNTWGGGNAGVIADGIGEVVRTLRTKLPSARVLLLGLLPLKDGTSPTVKSINERIAKLDDGKNVRFLNMGSVFAGPDGRAREELMADSVHLSAKGYESWAETMKPLLDAMMGK